MTIYSPAGIMGVWLAAGGSRDGRVVMTAVALAESGGDSTAVSPSDDHGLWQINGIHFAAFGVNAQTVLDPHTNARIAIALSGNGTNVAAWCTCWINPGRDCGHGFIPVPQTGSPAWDQLPRAQAVAGVGGTIGNQQNLHKGLDGMVLAWRGVGHLFGDFGQSRWNDLTNTATALGRLAR